MANLIFLPNNQNIKTLKTWLESRYTTNNQRREGMAQPDISCKEIKNNIPDLGLTSAHKKGGSGDEEAVWVTWMEEQ